LLREACDLGSGDGCFQIGKRAADHGDYKTAFDQFTTACAMSEQEIGCADLAELYLDGKGVARDEAKGRAILTSACDAGAVGPCDRLAQRLRDGAGVAAQPPQALVLFRKACDLGLASSCMAAATLLSDPKSGVTRDDKATVLLRDQTCKVA